MKIVTEIGAIAPIKKLKKVCAYARVSKDKDAMLQSLSSQVSHYNKLISSNPEWQFAGVYADEGISGTKEDRPEFVRMIEDAKAGKIDMIITKSISRFGRNTETVIKTVRMLKAINVDVYFESQKMHTLSEEGEFMLTVLASYYQEEARSVSENMKWRIKKDFEQGIAWGGNDNFGYKLNGRTLEIVPEQAQIVKRIFDMYINGLGVLAIAKALNEEGIKPTMGGKWIKSNVLRVITNINYIGDRVLQTTFRPDFLSKKKKRNNGELKQYYVEDDHEPIIDKETFMKNYVLYSQGTRLSYEINKKYYNDVHFVWCCEKIFFKGTKQPETSNPLKRAQKLIAEIITNDSHGIYIENNIKEIKAGAAIMKIEGKITSQALTAIENRVDNASFFDFFPVIYVIPYEKVKNIIEDPKDKKANLNSNEFLICELKSDCFDIIDIEKLFDKDFFERED